MGSKTLHFAHPRLLLAGLLMLIGFGVLSTGAMAQDEVDPEATTVATEAPVEDLATPEADAADDAAVASLPETGSGSSDGSPAIVLTASALIAATLGLAALGARRLIGRHET